LEEGEDVLLAGEADGDDQDERGGADDHAEGGEGEADFGGEKGIYGEAHDFAEDHGALGAGESAFEGDRGHGELVEIRLRREAGD
jgi:hypothetical protein